MIKVCIGLVTYFKRERYVKEILLPSIFNSLNQYQDEDIEFHLSILAQGYQEDLTPFLAKHIKHFTYQNIEPLKGFIFGDDLGEHLTRYHSCIPGFDWYLWIDDDYLFVDKSIKQFARVIKEADKDPMIGSVMCAGYLGGNYYPGVYKIPYFAFMWMNKGLLIRNYERYSSDFTTCFPKDLPNWKRAVWSSDNLTPYYSYLLGLITCKSFNHNTVHYHAPAGSKANVPQRFKQYFPEKQDITYSSFIVDDSWKDSDDWRYASTIYNSNIVFDVPIGGLGNLNIAEVTIPTKETIELYRKNSLERFGKYL